MANIRDQQIWLKLAHGVQLPERNILEQESPGMLPKPQAIGKLAKSNSSGLLTSTVLMNTMSRRGATSQLDQIMKLSFYQWDEMESVGRNHQRTLMTTEDKGATTTDSREVQMMFRNCIENWKAGKPK
ncbi:hypothetical protein STEG23_013606 [Scotinomys teguina]